MAATVRRTAELAAAVLACSLALTACGSSSADTDGSTSAATPAAFAMNGTLMLSAHQSQATRTTRFKCGGSGGYYDIQVGAQVVVYGPQGQTVAAGSITDAISHVHDIHLDISKEAGGPVDINDDSCELVWSVSGVPGGLGMYSYEISHRGALVVSEADAKSTQTATI